MDYPGLENQHRIELFYDLILSLQDPFQFVREEALVSLSHAFHSASPQFIEPFARHLIGRADQRSYDPLVSLLAHVLQMLVFEPCRRVRARVRDFLGFLDELFNGRTIAPMISGLATSCVTEMLQHGVHVEEDPVTTTRRVLNVGSAEKLDGTPAISPAGFLACGDTTGRLIVQTAANTQSYDFFKPTSRSEIPVRFQPLWGTKQPNVNLAYMTFVDDAKFLAVSNRSQVIVADTDISTDTICAFWMKATDLCTGLYVDCNHQSFRLVTASTPSTALLFDLATQQQCGEIRLDRTKPTCAQWLRPFSSLFYVCGQNLTIFDERMPENRKVAVIEGMKESVVGCNASLAMPFYIVAGRSNGSVTMYDLRTLRPVAHAETGKSLRQFEIHKHLPFGVGLGEPSLFTLAFGDGSFSQSTQSTHTVVHNFSLHSSEPLCAIRCGNRVSTFDIQMTI
jgi:hypothetical protein